MEKPQTWFAEMYKKNTLNWAKVTDVFFFMPIYLTSKLK